MSAGGSKQPKQSHSSLVGRTKDYYKTIHDGIASSNSHSHANELTDHEIMINEQVRKVLQHVKKIQTQVRQKPNSLTRMQFLHQLEDAYGFHGYKNSILPPHRSNSHKYSGSPNVHQHHSSDKKLLNSEGLH